MDLFQFLQKKPYELAVIRVSDLHIDPKYNREIKIARASELSEKFDEKQLDLLKVSNRDGKGIFYVFDGQHRLYALKKNKIADVLCMVYQMSYEEEANAFATQKDLSGGVTSKQKAKAFIEAKNPVWTDIDKILAYHGLYLAIGKNMHQERNSIVSCTAALEKIYKNSGPSMLHKVARLISKTWPNNKSALKVEIWDAIYYFCSNFSKEFKEEFFIKKLASVSPLQIIGSARANIKKASLAVKISEILVSHYDMRRRNKLQ